MKISSSPLGCPILFVLQHVRASCREKENKEKNPEKVSTYGMLPLDWHQAIARF
jgi:hypothetical protein